MKKAFMRGVCALNLEAMSMFREGEEGGRRPPPAAAAAAVNNNGAISYLSMYKAGSLYLVLQWIAIF